MEGPFPQSGNHPGRAGSLTEQIKAGCGDMQRREFAEQPGEQAHGGVGCGPPGAFPPRSQDSHAEALAESCFVPLHPVFT